MISLNGCTVMDLVHVFALSGCMNSSSVAVVCGH